MRYEHIELDLSTEACDALHTLLLKDKAQGTYSPVAEAELLNLANNLRARLQRRDVDPHCPKNQVSTEEWLDT